MKNRLSKRNINFSPNDIKLLLALVNEKKSIINCKRTDKVNSQVKEDCWRAIQKAFNAESCVFRTYRELKKKYENVKSMAKKKQISEENLFNCTSKSVINPLALSVGDSSQLPQLDKTSMEKKLLNKNFKPDKICKLNKSHRLNILTNSDTKSEDFISKNKSVCTRLSKNQNTILIEKEWDETIKNFLDCTTSWTKYSDVKAKLNRNRAQMEIAMLQEEHNIKMRHLEERHHVEMEKIAIELEILKANLELKRKELEMRFI